MNSRIAVVIVILLLVALISTVVVVTIKIKRTYTTDSEIQEEERIKSYPSYKQNSYKRTNSYKNPYGKWKWK